MRKTDVFKKHLREKRAVQIIDYGYDLENIKRVSVAAQSGMASSVCVSASKETIKRAKEYTKLCVFGASYNPFKLLEAMKEGADGIVIGNYNELYKNNMLLTVDDIYEIVVEAMSLTKKFEPFVAVTIPGYMQIEDQIELAKKLEILGVDLIQTEGVQMIKSMAIKGSVGSAKISIGNTMELFDNVRLPIMTMSGLTEKTVPLAFSAGARGVGVGSCVNKMDTQMGMTAKVRDIVGSIAYNRRASRELKEESINSSASFFALS